MAYGIMRVEKRKAQAIKGIQKENNRESTNLPRSDINQERTSENVYLVRSSDVRGDIERYIAEHGITHTRKDAVKMLDTVYTASPEFFKGKNKEQIQEYFNDCMAFHKAEFGDHVINAVVHYDETTPHMHVLSVPLKQKSMGVDEIGGALVPRPSEWRLCAKDILGGPEQYRERQNRFYEAVGEKYGLDRGECSPTQKQAKKHKDQLTHRMEKLQAEFDKAREQGIDKGLEEGHSVGAKEGFNKGYQVGQEKGFEAIKDMVQETKKYLDEVIERIGEVEELEAIEQELDGFDI